MCSCVQLCVGFQRQRAPGGLQHVVTYIYERTHARHRQKAKERRRDDGWPRRRALPANGRVVRGHVRVDKVDSERALVSLLRDWRLPVCRPSTASLGGNNISMMARRDGGTGSSSGRVACRYSCTREVSRSQLTAAHGNRRTLSCKASSLLAVAHTDCTPGHNSLHVERVRPAAAAGVLLLNVCDAAAGWQRTGDEQHGLH